jgi:hypothetical protein
MPQTMNLPPAPVDVDTYAAFSSTATFFTYMLQTMNLLEAEPLHQSMQGLFVIIVIINRVPNQALFIRVH